MIINQRKRTEIIGTYNGIRYMVHIQPVGIVPTESMVFELQAYK